MVYIRNIELVGNTFEIGDYPPLDLFFRKRNEVKLARHLISLRVHLSTAQLGWINSFVIDARGVHALSNLFKEFIDDTPSRYAQFLPCVAWPVLMH